MVAGDPYEIYFTEPEGYRMVSFEGPGTAVGEAERTGVVVKIGWLPYASGPVAWLARFEKKSIE